MGIGSIQEGNHVLYVEEPRKKPSLDGKEMNERFCRTNKDMVLNRWISKE